MQVRPFLDDEECPLLGVKRTLIDTINERVLCVDGENRATTVALGILLPPATTPCSSTVSTYFWWAERRRGQPGSSRKPELSISVFRIQAISPACSASLWAQVRRTSKIRNDSGRVRRRSRCRRRVP